MKKIIKKIIKIIKTPYLTRREVSRIRGGLEDWAELTLKDLSRYGGYLLHLNEYVESRYAFDVLVKKYPNEFQGYRGLARVSQKMGDNEAALEFWAVCFAKCNNKSDSAYRRDRMQYGDLLNVWGRCNESEKRFKQLLIDDPRNQEILTALARTARMAERNELAVQRCDELVRHFPDKVKYKKMYIHAVLAILDIDRAQGFYEQNLEKKSDLGYKLLQVDILVSQIKLEDSLKLLDHLQVEYPDDSSIAVKKSIILIGKCKTSGDLSFARQALFELEKFQDQYHAIPSLLEIVIAGNVVHDIKLKTK